MTLRNIERDDVDKFPYVGVVAIMPSVNKDDSLHHPLQMTLALENPDVTKSDLVVMGTPGFQFESREDFVERAGVVFDALQERLKAD